jgi:hypothetical protein
MCGLARFIGITEKELINLFNKNEKTKRVYKKYSAKGACGLEGRSKARLIRA